MTFKIKLKIFLVVLLIGAGSYFYYWYSQTVELRAEAEAVRADAEKYTELSEQIDTEYERCEEFIAQSSGEFGSFEYCTRFIEWANTSNLR